MTSRKARARKALRYGKRIAPIPGIVFPPSVTIAYAHNHAPDIFPLKSRREWRTGNTTYAGPPEQSHKQKRR